MRRSSARWLERVVIGQKLCPFDEARGGSSRVRDASAQSHHSCVPMSTKKRPPPSPAVDSPAAEINDGALRDELCKKKQVKSKAAFENGGCLASIAHKSASSVGVVTFFSALALNFYRKNGPSLSDTAQACLDIKYGFAAPPPPPALSKNPRLRQGVPGPPPPSPPPPSPPPLSLPPPPSPPPP